MKKKKSVKIDHNTEAFKRAFISSVIGPIPLASRAYAAYEGKKSGNEFVGLTLKAQGVNGAIARDNGVDTKAATVLGGLVPSAIYGALSAEQSRRTLMKQFGKKISAPAVILPAIALSSGISIAKALSGYGIGYVSKDIKKSLTDK